MHKNLNNYLNVIVICVIIRYSAVECIILCYAVRTIPCHW